MKKIPQRVAKIIPPITPVPTEWRLAAPAPELKTRGITPKMKVREVIRIARKRSLAAARAASLGNRPSLRLSTANSTIKMAFLAERAISVTRPIWKYTSLLRSRKLIAMSAPSIPKGTPISTLKGKDQRS